MFSFNYEKFDFWPIYESIIKHYPIGIPKDELNMYFQYPGLKQLESTIIKHIHNEDNFKNHWAKLEEILATRTQKEVIGTTYGQAPSFSSRIIMEKIPSGNLTRYKELFITVSLLGPYYTVLGQDTTEIKLVGKGSFSSTTIRTVSPENEYKELFMEACDVIEVYYKDYRFVPSAIYEQTLQGLEVTYSDERRDTVFHALFNDQVDLNAQKIGNDFFKSSDWIKEGYQDDGGYWTIYPPIMPD